MTGAYVVSFSRERSVCLVPFESSSTHNSCCCVCALGMQPFVDGDAADADARAVRQPLVVDPAEWKIDDRYVVGNPSVPSLRLQHQRATSATRCVSLRFRLG